jgi:hypothetical protein
MLTIFVVDHERQLTNIPEITPDNYHYLKSGKYFIVLRHFLLDGFYDVATFYNILLKANKIIYLPPADNAWTDTDEIGNIPSKKLLEDILPSIKLAHGRDVANIDHLIDQHMTNLLSLVDYRRNSSPQLWMAGCTITHSSRESDFERYGDIIKTKLNLQASWLTLGEPTSITWAADQILRSDIRTGDTIIWGLSDIIMTSTVAKFSNKISHYSRRARIGQDTIYQSIVAILEVNNICEKLGINLYIAGLQTDLRKYKINISSFIPMPGPCDFSPDGFHPGPCSHKLYANEILKRIQK